VTGRIKSILARLDRLGAAVDNAGDGNELKRRAILFESVFSVLHERTFVLTSSQSSRGYQG